MKASRTGEPAAALHVWRVALDSGDWPGAEDLPAAERDRATAMSRPRARRRWIASRWALRRVLAGYRGLEPAEVELRLGERGKPMPADPAESLRFNLSHSGGLALIAVCDEREVGVDIQQLGPRPADYYADWTRREAIAKCHGSGLWAPPPDTPVAVTALDAGEGFAAAVAVAGTGLPALRHFEVGPDRPRVSIA